MSKLTRVWKRGAGVIASIVGGIVSFSLISSAGGVQWGTSNCGGLMVFFLFLTIMGILFSLFGPDSD